MILTNAQIFNMYDVLNELINDKNNILPVKIGFILIKNFQNISLARQNIDKTRQKIILDRCANPQSPTKEEIEEINECLNELSLITEEIDLSLIPLDEIQNLKINLSALNILMPMLNEGGSN